jgi:hypothetical protein
LRQLLLLIVTFLLLVACRDEPEPDPPAAVAVLDLCGQQQDTEAFLTELFEKDRLEAVEDWFVQNMDIPGRIQECPPNGERRQLEAVWVQLNRVNMEGERTSTLWQWGEEPPAGSDYEFSTLNIFADPLASSEAFGYIIAYEP